MIIQKMKSLTPMTEYTPSWDFSFGFKRWSDDEKIKKIRDWLINNEQRIINSVDGDYDGQTGLGVDSLTGRFENYNLFNFANELPELTDLLNFIRLSYFEFIKADKTNIRDTVVVCWYNVLRDGQNVAEHHHGAGNDVYLSGNFILDDYQTNTNYRCPFDKDVVMPISNNRGILTLFPSCIPHYSDVYRGNDVRISIAFDIRLPHIIENSQRHAIDFMNEEIFNQLVKE